MSTGVGNMATSLSKYPRVVETGFRRSWRKCPRIAPRCAVCGAAAEFRPWVQVNWFRGDDAGPFPACAMHKEDAAALLASAEVRDEQA